MKIIKFFSLALLFSMLAVLPCAAQKAVQPKGKPAVQKTVFSPMELEVIDEINQARQSPQKYIGYLEEYKKLMKGNVLYLPNRQGTIISEGAALLDDAINDLKKFPKADALSTSNGVFKAAHLQLTDLKENSALSHKGKDGSDVEVRLFRFGVPGTLFAENISYKAATARDVVMNMILDDTVKNRPHRKNIFSPKFKNVGVACGIGNQKDTICVIVFADSFADKK